MGDYIAAVRGTLAMRRVRGQVRIELAFLGAALAVLSVGIYTVFVQDGGDAEVAEGRTALGLPVDDQFTDTGGLTVVDGDGFVVSAGDGTGGDGAGSGPGAAASAGDDSDGSDDDGAGGTAAGPGSTGPGSVPGDAPVTGVLPSEGSPDGTPSGGVAPGGGHGDGGTATSLPPGSATDPGTSTSSSTPTSEPKEPGTTPPSTDAPGGDGGLLGAILDLLGL